MVDTEQGNFVKYLSNIVGTSEPALRLLLSVVIGYPLAIFYRKFIWPLPTICHHIFMLVTGISICYFNYGRDTQYSLLAVLITYVLIKLLGPTDKLKIASFIFHMGFLTFGYFMTESEDYDIKWTMPHCVLVLRLIGLTFDICDSKGKQKEGERAKDMDHYEIIEIPNLLEIAAFVYFPSSCLVGPQFPYRQYHRFIHKEYEQYKGHIAYGMRRALMGVFYLAVYQFGSYIVSSSYLLSDEYANENYLNKLLYLGLWGRLTLYKYISIWLLSEGAATRFGLTFNGFKKKEGAEQTDQLEEDWSACENIKVILFEKTIKFTQYIESFNVNTNRWVARYIYKRLKFLGNRDISQVLTLLFLAVWHGFHSGYYMSFLMEFLVVQIERDFVSIVKNNEKLRIFLNRSGLQLPIYVVLKIYAVVGMGWCLTPFVFLTFSRYWSVYSSVHFIGFIVVIIYFLSSIVLRKLFPKDKMLQSSKTD